MDEVDNEGKDSQKLKSDRHWFRFLFTLPIMPHVRSSGWGEVARDLRRAQLPLCRGKTTVYHINWRVSLPFFEPGATETTQRGKAELNSCWCFCFRFHREKLQPQHRWLSRSRVPERRDVCGRRQHLQLPVQTWIHRLVPHFNKYSLFKLYLIFNSSASLSPSGQLCTEDVDECQLMPNACQNGGTCHNTYGSYQCVCVNGWTGDDCSENIDDCASAACHQGSTCHDRVASFFCECPKGRTGETLKLLRNPETKLMWSNVSFCQDMSSDF